MAAGVLEKSDYPGFNEETGILPVNDDPGSDEEVEIEMVEEEPSFLRGQTRMTTQHSPVKIVKASLLTPLHCYYLLSQLIKFLYHLTLVFFSHTESRWEPTASSHDTKCSI